MKFKYAFIGLLTAAVSAQAQQGFEYEVYDTDLSAPRTGEVELHTNFVPSGTQTTDSPDGRATHRAWRSSLEISTGLTSWLEASVYAVGYARSGSGLQFVGNRARVTAVAPQRWNLPLELGISQEAGFLRPGFSEYRRAYEITPIIGRKLGAASLVLNPAFERGLTGDEREWEFEPRARLSYALGGDEGVALEYYSVLGPVDRFDERSHQIHQLFATASGELPGGLEGGLGVGRGLTTNSDRWIITTRLEFRF
jgi:hypothetical protein